jgi:hypothetical protein
LAKNGPLGGRVRGAAACVPPPQPATAAAIARAVSGAANLTLLACPPGAFAVPRSTTR